MTQQIKIGVDANTAGAEQAVGKLERQATDTASAMGDIASEAGKAEQAIDRLTRSTERLAKARAALERETGASISDADAGVFLDNFDRMRTRGRGVGSQRLRQFDDFDGWYEGHRTAIGKDSAAAHHRRSVFATGLQGTNYARENGAPPSGGGGGGGGNDGGDGWNPGAGTRRAGSMAMGVFKGGLALAGINGIMSTIGSAVSKAAEEAISTDTLKRATGDLTVDFQTLRDNVRSATDGMGMVYQEGQRLAGQFAAGAGSAGVGDLQSNLRGGIGFGRSYGMDPSQSVGFFASMRKLGVTDNEQSNRRLALMIGDSIEKSGNSAKADEVLQAVSNWAEQSARLTLSTPNVGAYGSYLTTLMASGRPGLDPAGAAGILSAADSATRRGGAMGEASLNFSLAALLRSNPNMNPVSAMAVMEGGLFGTTRSTFGEGTSLGDWHRSRGVATPELDDRTNFEKMMPMLRQQYGKGSPYLLDAIKNHYGLSTIAQAAEFDQMYDNPANLRQSQGLLERAGLNAGRVSATGIQTVSRIAGADNGRELGAIFDSVMKRNDLSGSERDTLSEALAQSVKTGSAEVLKEALVRVVGTKEQEESEGQKTRQSVAGVENAITRFGSVALPYLNAIRTAIDVIARVLSPGYRNAVEGQARDGRVEEAAETKVNAAQEYLNLNPSAGARNRYGSDRATYMNRLRGLAANSATGEVNLDDVIRAPDPEMLERSSNKEHFQREYYRQLALRQAVEREYATMRPGSVAGADPNQANRAALDQMGGGAPSAGGGGRAGSGTRESQAMAYFMSQGWQKHQAAGIVGNLIAESGLDTTAVGDGGRARGIAQWHPDRQATMRAWAQRNGKDPNAYQTQLEFIQYEMFTANGGNAGRHLRNATTASGAARVFADKFERPAREADGDPGHWARRAGEANRLAGTPLPEGFDASAGGAAAGGGQVGISFAPATVTLQDAAGRARGQVTLNPFVSTGAAGTGRQ